MSAGWQVLSTLLSMFFGNSEEGINEKEGYRQADGLLTFLKNYYLALLQRHLFYKHFTPRYQPSRELFRRIKFEALAKVVDLKNTNLLIKVLIFLITEREFAQVRRRILGLARHPFFPLRCQR